MLLATWAFCGVMATLTRVPPNIPWNEVGGLPTRIADAWAGLQDDEDISPLDAAAWVLMGTTWTAPGEHTLWRRVRRGVWGPPRTPLMAEPPDGYPPLPDEPVHDATVLPPY